MNNRRAELLAGTAVVELPHTIPVGTPFKKQFGIARSTQHELIQRREVESALVGNRRGRRVIFTQSYLDYLRRQQEKEAAGEIGAPSPNPRARPRPKVRLNERQRPEAPPPRRSPRRARQPVAAE
jgi:hypothetical protein